LRANADLRAAVVAGDMTPDALAALPREELASDALRERDRRAVEVATAKQTLSIDALTIKREKKTGGAFLLFVTHPHSSVGNCPRARNGLVIEPILLFIVLASCSPHRVFIVRARLVFMVLMAL
jgi:hypothetical protein